MSINEFFSRLKRYDKNAEVIFDSEERIGVPTDLVLPRKRNKTAVTDAPTTARLDEVPREVTT
jgi:hypothetical protein